MCVTVSELRMQIKSLEIELKEQKMANENLKQSLMNYKSILNKNQSKLPKKTEHLHNHNNRSDLKNHDTAMNNHKIMDRRLTSGLSTSLEFIKAKEFQSTINVQSLQEYWKTFDIHFEFCFYTNTHPKQFKKKKHLLLYFGGLLFFLCLKIQMFLQTL